MFAEALCVPAIGSYDPVSRELVRNRLPRRRHGSDRASLRTRQSFRRRPCARTCVSGVGRFREHGHVGGARNGVELHPVLAVDVPRVTTSAAVARRRLSRASMRARNRNSGARLPITRKVAKGPYAQTDGPDQARDAQFELLTAASCRAAGATPAFAEPDVRVVVERRRLLVAAERVSSLASLENRVREARSQIEAQEANDQGLIAMDLTPALRLANRARRLRDASDPSLVQPDAVVVAREDRRVGEWGSGGVGRVRAASAYARLGAILTDERVFAEIRPWVSGTVPAFAPSPAPLRRFLGRLGSLGGPNR